MAKFSYKTMLPDGKEVTIKKVRMAHLRANITYICDRGCPNCNRACGIAKSNASENMTVEQFDKVMQDSVDIGYAWNTIILTGGEPSMHPNLIEFVESALSYVEQGCNPECEVHIATYHHPEHFSKVIEAIDKYPQVIIRGEEKTKPRIHKMAPYLAPIDKEGKFPKNHFYHGCQHGASLCGITVDYKGFYCCPIAPAIARVFGIDFAIKELKNATMDNLTKQYDVYCRLCGQYDFSKAQGNKDVLSKSWKEAVKKYNKAIDIIV